MPDTTTVERFAIDESRWLDAVVPLVLAGDLTLPCWKDEQPMGALEQLISELPAGVLLTPPGWQLHLINDDGVECCGMIVDIRRSDCALAPMLSAGWCEWDNFLQRDEPTDVDAGVDENARLTRAAGLLHEAIDQVHAIANGLLAPATRDERAVRLGRIVLAQLPADAAGGELDAFERAFEHSTIGELASDCFAATRHSE